MSVDDATPTPSTDPTADLDELLRVLADWRRRVVLASLDRAGPSTVDELARRLAAAEETVRPREAEVALVHDQLPRLAAADAVEFDREQRVCRLCDGDRATALLELLSAVRETGGDP